MKIKIDDVEQGVGIKKDEKPGGSSYQRQLLSFPLPPLPLREGRRWGPV